MVETNANLVSSLLNRKHKLERTLIVLMMDGDGDAVESSTLARRVAKRYMQMFAFNMLTHDGIERLPLRPYAVAQTGKK